MADQQSPLLVRRSEERGRAEHGWLHSKFSFSFADYVDPDFMGFRQLRVINEDVVEPQQGFGMHGHRDMEIVTVVISGALEHKDNMGNGSVIRPGDVQRMSAGTGVMHSEFNHSLTEQVHLLQIWILPAERGLAPSYEQKHVGWASRRNTLSLIASPQGKDKAVTIHQDASIHAGAIDAGHSLTFRSNETRYVWVQMISGKLQLGSTSLAAGDAAALAGSQALTLEASEDAAFLLFELA